MNILNSDQSRPTRVGTDRTIDDRTLWCWLELAQANYSLFESGMIEYWSDMSEHKFQEIVSLPTFNDDRISFCNELITFLETHPMENISSTKRRQIEYAKKYCTFHEIKEPESN